MLLVFVALGCGTANRGVLVLDGAGTGWSYCGGRALRLGLSLLAATGALRAMFSPSWDVSANSAFAIARVRGRADGLNGCVSI